MFQRAPCLLPEIVPPLCDIIVSHRNLRGNSSHSSCDNTPRDMCEVKHEWVWSNQGISQLILLYQGLGTVLSTWYIFTFVLTPWKEAKEACRLLISILRKQPQGRKYLPEVARLDGNQQPRLTPQPLCTQKRTEDRSVQSPKLSWVPPTHYQTQSTV